MTVVAHMLLFESQVSSIAHNWSKFQNLREKSFVGVFLFVDGVLFAALDPSSASLSSDEALEKMKKLKTLNHQPSI